MNARWQGQLSLYHHREAMRTAAAPEALSARTANHCGACAGEAEQYYHRSSSFQWEVGVRQRERPRQPRVSCQIVVSTLLALQRQRHRAHHQVCPHWLVVISLYSLHEGEQKK